jgi:hypothetical protein
MQTLKKRTQYRKHCAYKECRKLFYTIDPRRKFCSHKCSGLNRSSSNDNISLKERAYFNLRVSQFIIEEIQSQKMWATAQ